MFKIAIISLAAVFTAICYTSSAYAATYHYVYPGLAGGSNNGSSWTDAWRSFAGINWPALQTEAVSQPVYLYVKKGITTSETLSVGGSGSSDANRIIVTIDPADTGANPIISDFSFGIMISDKSYITISYLELTGNASMNNAVTVQGITSYITVDHLYIHDIPTAGIWLNGTNSFGRITNNLITRITSNGSYSYDSITGGGDNFTFAYNVISDACEDFLETGGSNLLINRNEIYYTHGYAPTPTCQASHPDMVIVGPGTNVTISNNYLHDNGNYSQGVAVFPYNGVRNGNIVVYNNVISAINSGTGGISIGPDVGGSFTGANIRVYNNTFYITGAGGALGIKRSGATSIDIKGNLFWDNGTGFGAYFLDLPAQAFATSDYNSITFPFNWGGTLLRNIADLQMVSGQDMHSINAPDPKFVSNGSDFHLSASSPSSIINVSGLDISSVFTTDKDGISRPQGLTWDIGAYEYVSGGTPTPTPTPTPDTTPPSAPTGVSVN